MTGLDGRLFVVLAVGIGLGWGGGWLHLQPQVRRLEGQVAALRGRVARLVAGRQTPTLIVRRGGR